MAEPKLRTVTRTQGNNALLKTGAVTPSGYDFVFEEVPVLPQAFRRMVRGLEFDVSEMALTTYLVAKAHGVPVTALPVFLVRGFHHGAIQVAAGSGIHSPRDLEGTRVGVNRGYTVTTGVWARGILAEEYGVDLDRITWVLSGDEHVEAYRPPANVVSAGPGTTLAQMLADGELAAVIGADLDGPDVIPLIPEPTTAGFTALQEYGRYPINHLIVIRDDLLVRHADLAASVFDAFARAKKSYVEGLAHIAAPTPTDRMYQRVHEVTGADPLPYGIESNRAVLEELMRHAVDQDILARPLPLAGLFADGTHELAG